MSIYRIKMNGKLYEMEVDLIEEGRPKKDRPAPAAVKSVINEPAVMEEPVEVNPNAVTSPMPGSILHIMKNAGDEVSKNEAVLVLEAMKMENEICVPRDGKISKICVEEGQAVAADVPLFEMED